MTFDEWWEDWKDYYYLNVSQEEAKEIWDAALNSVSDKPTEEVAK